MTESLIPPIVTNTTLTPTFTQTTIPLASCGRRAQRCGTCRHYIHGLANNSGTCTLVQGTVKDDQYCQMFSGGAS